MNAILIISFQRNINYIKANAIKILILVVPVFLYFITMILSFQDVKQQMLGLLGNFEPNMADFNALSIITMCGYTIFSMFNIEMMPITKPEATMFFVAPIKEQKLLLYFMVKSLTTIAMVFFGMYYINFFLLGPLFQFSMGQVCIVAGLQTAFVFFIICLEFFLFALKQKNAAIFYVLKFALIGGAMLLLLVCGYVCMSAQKDAVSIITALSQFLNRDFFTQIPIIGLMLTANGALYGGEQIAVWLVVAIGVLLISVAYCMDFSFAHCAFAMAEKYEGYKVRRHTQALPDFGVKSAVSKPIAGTGAWALYSKEAIEFSRTNRFLLSSQVFFFIGILLFDTFIFSFASRTNPSALIPLYMHLVAVGTGCIIFCIMPKPKDKSLFLPMYRLIPLPIMNKLMVSSVVSNFENLICAAISVLYILLTDHNIKVALTAGYVFFLMTSTATYIDILSSFLLQSDIFSLYRLAIGAGIKAVVLFFALIGSQVIIIFFHSFFYVGIYISVYALFVDFLCLLLSKALVGGE